MPMFFDSPYVAQVSASMKSVRGEPVFLGGESLVTLDPCVDSEPFADSESVFDDLRWEMDQREMRAFREAQFGDAR